MSKTSRLARQSNECGLCPKPRKSSLRTRSVGNSSQNVPSQTQQSKQHEQPDQLWDNLLSRQPELIRAAFASLDTSGQKAVLAHLNRMASDSGWQPEQKASAEAAIQALADQSKQE
jgi:hypothetical protein